MKNIFAKFAQMATLGLALTFTLSCSGGDDKGGDTSDIASFSGTWNASGERSIVFAGNTFDYKVNNTTTYSGTFSVSSSTITFNATGLGTASGNFTLSAETLVLSNHTWDNSVNGTYTKNGGGLTGTNGTIVDSRDNESYKWVKIDDQYWLAENLKYNASGSVCYDNLDSNCETYGKLYNWETAKTACPADWHLPSYVEWEVLLTAVGGSSTAGTKLKANSNLWNSNGNGTDDYNFSALPGGYGAVIGNNFMFFNVGDQGEWWTATEYESDRDRAYFRFMIYNNSSVRENNYDNKSNGLSVRCIKD